jgi:predicted amidohydrolase YtcJ
MGITATAVLPAWAVIFPEDKDLFATPQFQHFYGNEILEAYAGFARRFGSGAKNFHAANSKLLRALIERDALLVTGTDSPFVPYGAGLHAELRLFQRAGLEPWQVLRAATARAAQAAGVGEDLGQIKPGMIADLVVINGDPLADIKDADNVTLTIKGGRRYTIEALLTAPIAD